VDPAVAIPLIIPCLFVDAVADRGMGWMTPPVALPLIGVQPCAASRQVFDDEPMTSPPVRVVAHPKPRLARLTRDTTDNRRPTIGVGAVVFALIRAAAGRIIRGAMRRAFFLRVLVSRVRLKGGAYHHVGGGRRIPRRLNMLPQGMELLARQPQFVGQEAVGWPLATPRSRSMSAAGRGRVFAKTVPVSSV
jgi:hypothetical protein